ncbi:MAG: metallophosphoesterase [Anaerolineales bacterium]|nr:metallophosphoesterase [Anaerolineales bacterium]
MASPDRRILLAVSDDVSPRLNTCQAPERTGKVDLIVSCGDLPFDYLEFLMSVFNVPMYYVLGNHDGEGFFRESGKVDFLPDAGESIDGATLEAKGVLIAGLGGSLRFGATTKNQSTEAEMWRRVLKLTPKLLTNQVRYGRRLDILVTHSPARGIHEGEDPAHKGFAAFRWLLEWAKPRWMLHGHSQFARPPHDLQTRVGSTDVFYIPPFRLLDWDGEAGK